jgi:predicted ATPase/class 3 adenylate cyclase
VAELPSGTVTFLFTDLEGSTRLWEEHPDAMSPALARHDEILRGAVEARRGHVVKTTGDGIHAAFATAHDALDAAVAAQLELAAEPFPDTGALMVRMGVHTCEAEYRDGDYYGSEVNRAARLMGVAHGGQILVSLATSALVREGSVELVDLGEHRLRDLTNTERVFEVRAPGLAAGFAPLRALDALPGNLPRQVTTFVGREAEIMSLAGLVRGSALVTLTGVGGVGKTRLALQVAADVVPDFPDGAWFCEYAPVTDPGAVWETLAASLHVQPFPGRTLEESVLEHLAPKRLLLVLDNCEHLLDAVAGQVDALAQRCPRVSVLVTSREGLGLGGERIVAVRSLGVPADNADADALMAADSVRLFSDRARAAKSDFALDDRNAAVVGVLCRRLDGIPLAIELAAARVRSMSAEDLVARLDQRFKLLTRGSRAALERQQTLRATIDWSYDLLDPLERRALERVSVFAGGCDLAAAEAVLAGEDLDALDVADLLGQLVDKSLVVADDSGGAVRYRLLETIRQYAQERLQESGDTATVRRRHADHYVGVAEAAGPHLRSGDQLEWTDTIARDTDNLRAALDWALETASPAHALRLVAPLAVDNKVGDVAMDWAALATAIPGAEDHVEFPVVSAWAAWGAARAGDHEGAQEFLATAERVGEALDAPPWPLLRGRATLAMARGDLEQSRQYCEEWVAVARASGGAYEVAEALNLLGPMLGSAGRRDDAIAALDEAVRIERDLGLSAFLSFALAGLAGLLPLEESPRAIALLDEAIDLATQIASPLGVAGAKQSRGRISAGHGDWPAALGAGVDSAEQLLQLGDVVLIEPSFQLAGLALGELGQLESSAVFIGRSAAAPDRILGQPWALDLFAAVEVTLRESLGDEQFAALTARGAALSIADAVAYLRAEADRVLGRN